MTMERFMYPKLRGRIIEKFMTYANFAEHMGIQDSALSNKLSGKNSITKRDIEKWGQELEIPKEEYGIYFF